MRKNLIPRWKGIFIMTLVLFGLTWSWHAKSLAQSEMTADPALLEMHKIMDRTLNERMKYWGTLDIYDPQINAVRNLTKIEFLKDVSKQGNYHLAFAQSRDNKTGEVVMIAFVLSHDPGAWSVTDIKIHKVEKLPSAGTGTAKEYSDTEIRDFIKKYCDSQEKFSGSMMIFDEEQQTPRSVKLEKIDDQLRKFGKLSIVSAHFKDVEIQADLKADVTVENNNGVLKIQSLRIQK